MYAARRRQRSVRRKFQFGKLCIGQPFQLFDNLFGQLPQGSFVGHQIALHESQLLHQPQPDAGQGRDILRFCLAFWSPFSSVANKKASGLFRSLAMESMVFYSCFTANFSAISSRRSKVCFSSGSSNSFTLIPEGQVNNRCNPLVNALLSSGVLCIKLVYTSKDIFSICILCENIAIPVIIMFEFNPIDCVIFFANMIPLIFCVVYPSMLSS